MDHLDADSHSELKAIDHLVEHFEYPLQSAGADTDLIKPEFVKLLLSYAGHFIQLSTIDYQSVWWQIFHSPSGLIYLYLFNCFLLCQPPMEK